MEFIEFINRTEVEIIRIIEKAGYKTAENTKLCLLGDNYVGFFNSIKTTNIENIPTIYAN